MALLAAGVTAVAVLLCGNVAQALPAFGSVSPSGAVQFQGVASGSNVLSFTVTSSSGITGVTVTLTGTTLPGIVTTNFLTPSSGLTVSGTKTDETITAPLSKDTLYSAVISASDAGGTASVTANFDTINSNYFTFEAEDFDYGGGKFFDSLPAGTFPGIDAYAGLTATIGIDCNNHSPTSQPSAYRTNPLETENASDTPRTQYSTSGHSDYDVGYNIAGDWGNYTRHYPAGLYNIYLRGSGGNGPQSNACGIGLVTSGWGTTTQNTNLMGSFSVAGLGWQSYTWCPALDANGNLVAWAAGGDQETLRFTVIGANCNENFYLLVPAAPTISPGNTPIYQGNPATLSIAPYALSSITGIQWQTDNGSGGTTWADAPGSSTGTTYSVPTNLTAGPYQFRVLVAIASNATPVTVTSAVVALNILPPSPPVVLMSPVSVTDTLNTNPAVAPAPAVFSAAFTGSPTITYQWLSNAITGGPFFPIPGQTNTSLTVQPAYAITTNQYELAAINGLGSSTSAPATLIVGPVGPIQLAGDLIVELRPADLLTDGAETTWTNRSASGNSVGNFKTGGGGAFTVSDHLLNTALPLWAGNSVNALYVGGNSANALFSAALTPAEINGNGPVSMEAWVYCTSVVNQQNQVSYGLAGGSGSPAEERQFGYGTAAYGGFTADYGSSDTGWATAPSIGWHYLAMTYDGTTVRLYQDGVANGTAGSPMNTIQTRLEIGQADGATDTGGSSPFQGYIAAVRVMSGVLTAAQVANNFNFGPLAQAPITVSAPTATPAAVLAGNPFTLTDTATINYGGLVFTNQWLSDNGSGGASWTPIAGATNTTLIVSTTNLASATYQYELMYSSIKYGIVTTSSPVSVTVSPATPPELVQDTTPGSLNAIVGLSYTLTALFAGEPPIALQWQVSGDDLNWTNTGVLTTNITIFSQVPVTNWYRLTAANPLGSNASSAAQVILLPAPPPPAPQSVLTFHYDNTRDGANTNESILTLNNVNPNDFGRLFTYPVDGYVFAQALIATNVTIPGQGTHDVLYVVTENDTVYAFDADKYVPTPYWTNSFLDPAAGIVAVPGGAAPGNIYPVMGITATPVIDPVTGTIYVEAKTQETSGTNVAYVHRLHALDISTGQERTNYNSPVVISCTNYPGTGTPGQNDTDGAGHILWNGLKEHCRPALLLANGMVYICYASPGDHPPYYGWVFAYDAHTLAQKGVFNDDPNAGYGGIWMTGNGAVADTNGYIYLNTGNGAYDSSSDYGDTVLKLNGTNGLALVDYFTPYNAAMLFSQDLDVSSAGMLLLPDSAGSASHPHLLLSGSKTGALFLLDRDNMGHFNAAGDTQIVQELSGAVGGMWCSPAYFNGHVYIIGASDYLKSFTISNAAMSVSPVAQSQTAFGYATPTISAYGTSNAIVWAMNGAGGNVDLHAFNATNVAQELYNSDQNPSRDNAGSAVEFTLPTVANGKVYVGAQYAVSVFGNGAFLPTPTIAPNPGVYTNSLLVTLSDSAAGAAIYYTLDGAVPTTNSTLYTGPFTITSSVNVEAIAAMPGAVNSGAARASFINSSSVGSGTGLLGSYWADTASAAFTNVTFTNLPTLVRTDATVNFNWNAAGPDPSIGQTNYVVRWTGCVQPQFSENYTFYATADDGVMLYVNGQQLVDAWVDEAATTYQRSIALKAQQLYNIEMDYYQDGGGAVAELQWSSPSTPEAVIPQSQLYPYSNPPPTVVLSSPTNNSSFTASASVTIGATADAPYNPISTVTFYTNGGFFVTLSNSPYAPLYEVTAAGLGAGSYALTAVATDGSGLSGTSAPVNITVATGSGQPYGLTTRGAVPAYFNMPTAMPGILPGSLPLLLSQTGVFSDTPAMIPAGGLIPYQPNVALFSDNATKIRYMGVPYDGGVITPDQQISFAPTGTWTFPGGTVFVKTFELQTNSTNAASLMRLETRLLVQDSNGGVYGVTYKWRPDNSDADLLTASSNQTVFVTTPAGIQTNTWYYPSPADCLTCHTKVANYVLGVNTRQLNALMNYPSSGVSDNELRTLNRLGLLNPAFDESAITNFEAMSALTNLTASLQERARSYLDANCAQCHQPGGTGPTFDARYETPLASQHITNYPALFSLGNDNECIVHDNDIWRSALYARMNIVDETNATGSIQMPPLARLEIDTNAIAVIGAWIGTLPGAPTLAPPAILPDGGMFSGSVSVALQSTNSNAALYYTLDGTLPTTNSFLYAAPFNLTNTATVTANAFWAGFNNSIASSARFVLNPPVFFTFENFATNGQFQLGLSGVPGDKYVLQASTNLVDWTALSTNTAPTNLLNLIDPGATNFRYRFYRVLQQ